MPADALASLLHLADPEDRARQYAGLDERVLNLAVAENVVIYPVLKRLLYDKLGTLPVEATTYKPSYGTPELRKATADLLTEGFGPDVTVDPGDVYFASGVSATLECLGFSLFDPSVGPHGTEPGDHVVVTPAPCWQGFAWSFGQRPPHGVVRPFPTKAVQVSLEDVQASFAATEREFGRPPRLLVLTSPGNPTGVNYAQERLEPIYDWVLNQTDADIISDEMYFHSQTANATPPFTSALALRAYRAAPREQRDRVHVVWGFAKDFGLSGWKAGAIVSTSAAVREGMLGGGGVKDMAWFSPVNALKSHLLTELLTRRERGEPMWRRAIREYTALLTAVFAQTQSAFDRIGVPYLRQTDAAQFLWLDLSRYLGRVPRSDAPVLYPEISDDEARLHRFLIDKARVQLLPGQTLSNPEPGWFRFCYTAAPWERPWPVLQAITRMGEALGPLDP